MQGPVIGQMPDNYPLRQRTHNFHGLTFPASLSHARDRVPFRQRRSPC